MRSVRHRLFEPAGRPAKASRHGTTALTHASRIVGTEGVEPSLEAV